MSSSCYQYYQRSHLQQSVFRLLQLQGGRGRRGRAVSLLYDSYSLVCGFASGKATTLKVQDKEKISDILYSQNLTQNADVKKTTVRYTHIWHNCSIGRCKLVKMRNFLELEIKFDMNCLSYAGISVLRHLLLILSLSFNFCWVKQICLLFVWVK